MNKKFAHNIFCLFMTFMFVMAPVFPSMASQPEPIVEGSGEANPRALLTLEKEVWSSGHDVQFLVKYVVNDGTNRIVDVLEASVIDWQPGVWDITEPTIYLASGGAYATISCEYRNYNVQKVETAIATLRP